MKIRILDNSEISFWNKYSIHFWMTLLAVYFVLKIQVDK